MTVLVKIVWKFLSVAWWSYGAQGLLWVRYIYKDPLSLVHQSKADNMPILMAFATAPDLVLTCNFL